MTQEPNYNRTTARRIEKRLETATHVADERWDYQAVILERRLDNSVWNCRVAIRVAGYETELYDGPDDATPNIQVVLDEQGRAGWELVGPPVTENAVFQMHGVNVGKWFTQTYWMKRRAT